MPTLAAVVHDLGEQWDMLRAWLEQLPDPASAAPSTLPGWSIADLVAHLGRNWDAISALRPAEPDDGDPLTLSEYLASYRTGDPTRIDKITHELAAAIADDPLEHLDRAAERAFSDLEPLSEIGPDAIVVARRGTIALLDFAVSRLIEFVVHAYDLAPTLPLPEPVDPTARTIVAQSLMDVARRRTGLSIEVADEEAWIKAAAGRIDWSEAVARGAIRPTSISDGTPDLEHSLPLL